MNMSTQELDKFMADGKLLSDDFLPKFARQIQKEMGDQVVSSTNTARSAQERYNNSLLMAKVAINDAGLSTLTKDYYELATAAAIANS